MKKLLGLLLVGLIAAIAVPSAVLASPGDTATVAKKKKKTYCQKAAKSVKGKLKGKSHGFSIYVEGNGSLILICQDKPKFYGEFSITKGDKLSSLRVSPKKCAVVKVAGGGHNDQVYLFSFDFFLSGNGQASIYTVGYGQASGTNVKLALSSNCVAAFGNRVNGLPQVEVQGTNAFGYTGQIKIPTGANMTDKELAAVQIKAAGATAIVTWTEGGVPKSYTYAKPAGF
ncbi:MAG: hypothetical protein JHC98_04515 [Thermoleophilaceae bacterium]|nr:hypothetical protein [Thermoleophilaceae bacterium]